MPYSTSNKKIQDSAFRMNGSPHKMGTIEGTSAFKDTEKEAGKKHQHPHTKKEQEAIERRKGKLEDRIGLTSANKKAVTKQKALYSAGKITKKQLDQAIDEISRYVDY